MFFITGFGGGLEAATPSIESLEAMLKRSKEYHAARLKLLSAKVRKKAQLKRLGRLQAGSLVYRHGPN